MAYEYLKSIVSPNQIVEAVKYIGEVEVKGDRNNPVIMGWAKSLGLDKIYTNDDISWCALFVCFVMMKINRRITLPGKDIYDYLRAGKYVTAFSGVTIGYAAMGDILIFNRPGGHHIGFYVGEDKNNYYVLGGNQGNMVSVVKIAKSRILAIRRPQYSNFVPQKMWLTVAGKVSGNEA